MKSLRWNLCLSCISALLLCACDAPASETKDPWVDALRDLALPLTNDADLDPLLEAIGDSRLVLLGESSHGTSEFYTWRDRISRRLIAERGFSFIAVEGDWASLQHLDRYVKGIEDGKDAREVLRRMDRWPLWMWANEEVADLAEWLRAHNQKLPPAKRVGFHGMDVYGWEHSLQAAMRYVRDLCADLAGQVEKLYAGIARHEGDTGSYARAAAQGASNESDVRKVVALLREDRERLETRDAAAYFAAKQNALVVKNAEAHIRQMTQAGPDSWNSRARHMQVTVERLKEHYGPGARGIVWAHNTHIGDARATAMGAQGLVNIGQLSRERWGPEAVFLTGFSTHRGQVLAGRNWGGPRETMQVPPSPAGTVEAALNGLDLPQSLLVFRGKNIPSVLREVRGHRAMGVIYHPEQEAGNYVPSILPQRYDALIFLAETAPLRPLHER